ncbi:MAG TPA: hypothetical protein ENJ44_04430, partial [Oceanospirillales bacterium]|nr:hypothetical protein [Oceanospirillales bacterium]
MQYKINDFSYDDESGKFIKNDNEIQLTKAQKKLFNYFIANPKIILSKQQLMDDVWGRVITENSIEKAISKLRLCIEEDAINPKMLITHFGHGVSLEADIAPLNVADKKDVKNTNNAKLLIVTVATFAVLLAVVSILYLNKLKPNTSTDKDSQTVALLMTDNDDWLSSGSVALLQQIMLANDKLLIKNKQDKPENLNAKQYIEYQWKLSPNLKIIKSKVEYKQGLFNITISITDAKQKKQTHVFADKNYNIAIKQASQWLFKSFKLDNKQQDLTTLLPQSNFIMEIYLRGLEKLSKGELKAASSYFDICINENPNFLPAYLNLARVKSKQEDLNDAMSLLDTLSQLSGFSTIKTEAQILKARLYMQLNQQDKAKNYLENILAKNTTINKQKIHKMQSLLISIYINLNKNQEALNLVEKLESGLDEKHYPELLRSVYYNKARIMQVFDKYQEAKKYVIKSKDLSNKLGDLLAESTAFRLLASISKNLGNENDAILYLDHALAISKSLKDDIGVAKTISFLVPNLISKGKFSDS